MARTPSWPARARRFALRTVRRAGWHVARISADERRYMDSLADTSTPLPDGAELELRDTSPRLDALRVAYRRLDWPCTTVSSWWSADRLARLELQRFRGDSPFIWHYRELLRATRLKYLLYAQYIRSRDPRDLLGKLGDDGAFGCWTFEYPGIGLISRDLLDSVNELYFLDRHLSVLDPAREPLRILDVGAGYGRFAHRSAVAVPSLADYACVDAIPEATFLCEYYTAYRGACPPVRVIELPDAPGIQPGSFDLAINIHSFSECPAAAVEWWMALLARLRAPYLFLVPNDADASLTLEADGSRRDYRDIIEATGYELVAEEPAIVDRAVSAELEITDRHLLFRQRG